jgi:hypothetical protein
MHVLSFDLIVVEKKPMKLVNIIGYDEKYQSVVHQNL